MLIGSCSTKQSSVLLSLQQLFEANQSNAGSLTQTTQASLRILQDLQELLPQYTDNEEREERRDQIQVQHLEEISSKLSILIEGGQAPKLAGDRILQSLDYKRMTARYEKIVDSHKETFEWLLHRPSKCLKFVSTHNFVDWLTHGESIFWIAGKAGSGKSTLMKFLVEHAGTEQALREWAGGKDLVIGSFYFWHAGTDLQKTQEGLLRSLLHNVLSQCRYLMPLIVPKRSEEYFRTDYTHGDWNRTELLGAFAELSKQSSLSGKLCFFIDGLDEYDGDHEELISLIRSLTQSKDIKICASSRPWNVFEAAFGRGTHPAIRLEDLTRKDIRLYVNDTLENHSLFYQLRVKEKEGCIDLVNEIVDKACGVFLWVVLVVRSLIQGLTNADRIVDLQRRLRYLPADLQTYFKHMLGTIETFYEQQTAQTFEIALHALEPLSLMTYVMLDELDQDPDYARNLEILRMKKEDVRSKQSDMKRRINARCMDLLEVVPTGRSSIESSSSKTPMTMPELRGHDVDEVGLPGVDDVEIREVHIALEHGPAQSGNVNYHKTFHKAYLASHNALEYEVDFLHRTVRDFFRLRETQSWIADHIPPAFSPENLLCNAMLAQIKVLPFGVEDLTQDGRLSALLDNMMSYAHEIELRFEAPATSLLDSLSCVMASHNKALPAQLPKNVPKDGLLAQLRRSFLGFAVQRNLQLYVAEKLDDRSMQAVWDDSPLILGALKSFISQESRVTSAATWEMVNLLIRKGVCLGRNDISWPTVFQDFSHGWLTQTSTSFHEETFQLEALNQFLMAREDVTEVLGTLKWADIVLTPVRGEWSDAAATSFQEALSMAVVLFLETGPNPNTYYRGLSLWGHFLRSIRFCGSSFNWSSSTRVLKVIRAFLRHGADVGIIVWKPPPDDEEPLCVSTTSGREMNDCEIALDVKDILTTVLREHRFADIGSELNAMFAEKHQRQQRLLAYRATKPSSTQTEDSEKALKRSATEADSFDSQPDDITPFKRFKGS